MIKLVSIIGARPEFIQCAPLRKAFQGVFEETLVHTGQHFDYSLADIHLEDLAITGPDIELNVGASSFGNQLGKMIDGLTSCLERIKPSLVIVRGDTNSTLAGALSAARLGIPLAHIEAGERSFNSTQPEEQNRIVVDRLSSLLFCVNKNSEANLKREGRTKSVFVVGDVMLDSFLRTSANLHQSNILERLKLEALSYLVLTLHRAENTDDPTNLQAILRALGDSAEQVVFPIHPRTSQAILKYGISLAPNIAQCEPLRYLDMLRLTQNARVIVTDSGGVQREAYFLKRPCLTCRTQTEWVDTTSTGWNNLVGTDYPRILAALKSITIPTDHPQIFGDGNAARHICGVLKKYFEELMQ